MDHRARWWWAVAPLLVAAPLRGQGWDAPGARQLAERAADRRERPPAGDPSWRARAHGLVLFLAQVGDGLHSPPRLVRADELDVEVYRSAPAPSKQVILGWRTKSWLPTDIAYHRDHLGIVTDGFGDRIRIGDGDEVRDVIHPLSPAGLAHYAFALTDSVRIALGGSAIVLDRLDVRPKDPRAEGVVGSLYLDRATGELVRFRFGFTRASYVDPELEDITISLESALVDRRIWLPFRQEIELRRRTEWLDFPARGIIRGRWEIGDYDLHPFVAPAGLADGPAIGGLLTPGDSARPWGATLEEHLAGAALPMPGDAVAEMRRTVGQIAPRAALDQVRAARLHAPALSQLIRFDRVEGVALGAGLALAPGNGWRLTPRLGIGLATGRMTGGMKVELRGAGTTWMLEADRSVRDFSDLPVISPALNSLTAEEGGDDHGDYLLLDRSALGVEVTLGGGTTLRGEVARERASSLPVAAHPASGSFRPNPSLVAPGATIGRLTLHQPVPDAVGHGGWGGTLSLEGGGPGGGYLRAATTLEGGVSVGGTELRLRGVGGIGTDALPAWRSFAIGGRGTLVGEPFRAWGGREVALLSLEWRVPVVVPSLPLGTFASTGREATLAPFVAAGWAGGGVAGMPWVPSPGARPVAGMAVEWLFGLLRAEAGWSLRTGSFGVTVDVSRAWWGLL